MKFQFKNILLIALVASVIFPVHSSAAAKKDRVRMKMYYFKEADESRKISIQLTAGSGKKMHGVKNGDVQLTSLLNDSTIVLANLETDTTGLVEIYLDKDYVLPMDEDGKCVLEAVYKGDDKYRNASKDIEIIDVKLAIDYKTEDSVNYLILKASQLDLEGNEIPVEELDVIIGVQRLYSVLNLDDLETDEDGIAELEVPDNIPGNAEGQITFVAKIDDHDEFGTVTFAKNSDWGVPVSYENQGFSRQLFTDEAPIWMIAVVFIILAGAWYHFFLSISKLIKLKKAGKTT